MSISYHDLVRSEVKSQPVYEPGKPIEMVAREYGLEVSGILKLASNESPLGPSPLAQKAAIEAVSEAHLYPDGGCTFLREKIASVREISAEQVIVGNGSNEIMVLLAQAFLKPGDDVVFGAQAFIVYKLATLLFGATPVEVPMPDFKHDLDLMAEAVTEKTKLVFLPSPNNPTGTAHSQEELDAFIEKLPEHVIFCLDEAYAEYLQTPPDLRQWIKSGAKVFCTRTFSKIYGLAGFRLGYGYGNAELISLLHQIRQPFNVNAIAQKAALAALGDDDFVAKSRDLNAKGLAQLSEALLAMGLEIVPSAGNFLLLRVEKAAQIFEVLQQQGIIVRPLKAYSLPNHVRITVGTEKQNAQLLSALSALLAGPEANLLVKEPLRR